jgi:hypothetical protein
MNRTPAIIPRLAVFAGLAVVAGLLGLTAGRAIAGDDAVGTADTVGGDSHFLRGAYQYGSVPPTNTFVEGDYPGGEPIDTFWSMRLEFGWQTNGTEDWHHLYNFPSFGLGLHYCDYFADEKLGTPTSVYGFFSWPVKRWQRNALNVDLEFGLADNWVAFDEVTNPYNVAIGAGRSVYIDVGLNYEFALAPRWWLQAGFTGTHYSNGGSQKPNRGINQVGALAYLKYDLQERHLPSAHRALAPYRPRWELATTLAFGVRNLSLDLRDNPDYARYLTKNYAVANLMLTASRQFSYMSRYDLGLDLDYDETVPDVVALEALRAGEEAASVGFIDKLGLGVFAGYEHVVARANLIIQLGYSVLRKEVPDLNGNDARLPRFYQRLGLKYHVFDDVFLGLNVRFHDFSAADNLEFNVGYRWGL